MESRYDQISPVPPLTKVTKVLIITCIVIYLIDFVLINLRIPIKGLYLYEIFGLVPAFVKDDYWIWQFFTYIFFHGQPLHLLLNMLILWYFGSEIEMRIGEKAFLFYFFLCGVGAGLFNFAINLLFQDPSKLTSPIIGASGAIFGILAAYGLFFGNRYFLVFFLFPMKAKYFVLVIAAIELITGVEANAADNVAHFAHIGGMLVGGAYIYLRYFMNKGGGGKNVRDAEKEKLRKQFTLIVNESDKRENSDRGPFWN